MKDIIKIVKSLEDSSLLLKGVSETIQNEAKEQKIVFLCILLCTLGAILLGNILAGKGINRSREGVIRAGYGNEKGKKKKNESLIPPHPLTTFQVQKHYQNNRRFNSVYSRDNLSRIKDVAYVMHLDEYSDNV